MRKFISYLSFFYFVAGCKCLIDVKYKVFKVEKNTFYLKLWIKNCYVMFLNHLFIKINIITLLSPLIQKIYVLKSFG